MPKVAGVEGNIQDLEGFRVRITESEEKDASSAKRRLAGYGYARAARDKFTVARWREHRFKQRYPHLEVEVLFEDGTEAKGRCKLATVPK